MAEVSGTIEVVQDVADDSLAIKDDMCFGGYLISNSLLSHSNLTKALKDQENHGSRLGEVLTRLKMLSEDEVTAALAGYLSMEHIKFDDMDKIDMNVAWNSLLLQFHLYGPFRAYRRTNTTRLAKIIIYFNLVYLLISCYAQVGAQ